MYSVQSIYDQLRQTITNIDRQIEEVVSIAEHNGTTANKIKDMNGGLLLSPLLVAKATCLSGIASLKSAELRNRKGA